MVHTPPMIPRRHPQGGARPARSGHRSPLGLQAQADRSPGGRRPEPGQTRSRVVDRPRRLPGARASTRLDLGDRRSASYTQPTTIAIDGALVRRRLRAGARRAAGRGAPAPRAGPRDDRLPPRCTARGTACPGSSWTSSEDVASPCSSNTDRHPKRREGLDLRRASSRRCRRGRSSTGRARRHARIEGGLRGGVGRGARGSRSIADAQPSRSAASTFSDPRCRSARRRGSTWTSGRCARSGRGSSPTGKRVLDAYAFVGARSRWPRRAAARNEVVAVDESAARAARSAPRPARRNGLARSVISVRQAGRSFARWPTAAREGGFDLVVVRPAQARADARLEARRRARRVPRARVAPRCRATRAWRRASWCARARAAP
jgi:hypothetical protein